MIFSAEGPAFSFDPQGFIDAFLGDLPRCAQVCLLYEVNGPTSVERGRIHLDERKTVERLAKFPPTRPTATQVISFVDWATATYPSRYRSLVFRDHGSPLDEVVKRGRPRARSSRNWLAPVRQSVGAGDGAPYLSDGDLRRIGEKIEKRGIDIYGFDACAMSSFEVAFELRHVASYMVASMNFLRQASWPYAAMLRKMNERGTPRAAACEVAAQSALTVPEGFLMALDLAWASRLAKRLDTIGAAATYLLANSSALNAGRGADFEGLADLKNVLAVMKKLPKREPPVGFGPAVQDAYQLCSSAFAVAGTPYDPQRTGNCGGVGIFFPQETEYEYWGLYGELKFARRNRWRQFVQEYCFG
ncbi:MAG TPA: clostripain-related cysteine peptidase [Polyangiaceae bacterium]|jgi:hypothetical protein